MRQIVRQAVVTWSGDLGQGLGGQHLAHERECVLRMTNRRATEGGPNLFVRKTYAKRTRGGLGQVRGRSANDSGRVQFKKGSNQPSEFQARQVCPPDDVKCTAFAEPAEVECRAGEIGAVGWLAELVVGNY